MEEYVRFVLDDPGNTEELKRVRHDLAAALRPLGLERLLQGRDTPGDVGTRITTESESKRTDARSVFVAAAKRLPEALRAIEEYAKIIDPTVGARIEALRYRAYEIEQRITLRGERSARFARVRLYLLVTETLCSGPWLDTAKAAISGGADCIQLREKQLEDGELLERARRLSRLCRDHNVLFIINDRPDIARLADADGVHLGQTDMTVTDARRIVGADRLIGLSTHNPQQVDAAIAARPDYIAVGPMFDSATKPQSHIAGVELLTYAANRTSLPIVPIGGITKENLVILQDASAQCVSVCSAVISAESPEAAAADLRHSWNAPSESPSDRMP